MPQSPAPTLDSRRTASKVRAEPVVWLMGGALTVCVAMILTLLTLVVIQGFATFWPKPIDLVTLKTGETFLGNPLKEQDIEQTDGPVDENLPTPRQRLYRVGNRDLGQAPFRWVPVDQITSLSRPKNAVQVQRQSWGIFLGTPRQITQTIPADDPDSPDQIKILAHSDQDDFQSTLQVQLAAAQKRRHAINQLVSHEMGKVNQNMERLRLRIKEAELERQRTINSSQSGPWLNNAAAILLILLSATSFLVALRLLRTKNPAITPTKRKKMPGQALFVLSLALALFSVLESPWMSSSMSQDKLDSMNQTAAVEQDQLEQRYQKIQQRVEKIQNEDEHWRIVIEEPTTGRFAPQSQTLSDQPILLSQIVRIVPANNLNLQQKFAVYFNRWSEFISADPREANTEGGVYPVLFSTVLLTILLSLVVAPFGVIAALYMREYAKQGLLTSIIRIAINNLAGVPSIVYGVFGLGFFCYTLGRYIDSGPTTNLVQSKSSWWVLMLSLVMILLLTFTFSSLAAKKYSKASMLKKVASLGWLAAVVLVIALFVTTPYFHGFFEASLPTPTFGTRGLLWSVLTLSLLTLPVVIVSTEEAISAVPSTMRQGSFGCGASKWQTIRRIVLPSAAPGIMTGMILAMARGAGEVAPLMLVGAVKLAPELPMTSQPPFLHLDRSFMHLGLHIFDLGFQSPDSQAARPMVWTSTLLLITVVVFLNLLAIWLRARLRKKFSSNHF